MVAFGTSGRVAKTAVRQARAQGLPVGLLRPISLWPFPARAFEGVLSRTRAFLAVEMSLGQMVDDVRLAVRFERPVFFYGRAGGVVPTPAEVLEQVREIAARTSATGPRSAAKGGLAR